MTVAGPRQEVRRKLDAFANRVERQVSDTRSQQFLREMIVGLVASRHVPLSKIARATGHGLTNVHAARKRLSCHLKSEHWDTAPVFNQWLNWWAKRMSKGLLILSDLNEITKSFTHNLGKLRPVRDSNREIKQ